MSPADIDASLEFLLALGEASRDDPSGTDALRAAMQPVLDQLISALGFIEGERRRVSGGGYVAEGEVERVGDELRFIWRSLTSG